jgi:uncharacterized protein YndB with AHSA1/START domain
MTPREHSKALLVEWLIRFGTDWVDNQQLRESGLQMEIGRLERMHYLEYTWEEEEPLGSGLVKHRLTEKGLALLKENDRE